MKRVLPAVLAALLLTLCACGRNAAPDATEPQTDTTEEVAVIPTTEPAATTESVSEPDTDATGTASTTAPVTKLAQPTILSTTSLLVHEATSYPFTLEEYFRVGSEETMYRKAAIITSRNALERYYSGSDYATGNATELFDAELAPFDEAWFATHSMIILHISEPSGSIRHDVQRIVRTESGEVMVELKRLVPQVGTCDMATTDYLLSLDPSVLSPTDRITVAEMS